MKNSALIKLAILCVVLGLATGCASTDQLKQMQSDIARAQESADAAMAAARSADRKADAAMNRANAAQAAADDCSERCNRIAEKAMAK